ncbi:MAG TPA: HNH endonuclease signature motif containing protein [Actinophytocola sp.]|jgi:5-methylcytosine-specific restriction endonuclease McrA|nr:HNH endonuclease signature motif containing protein [Actinophytocola sp.]
MAYSLHEDNLGRDPRWMALARLHEPDDAPDVLELPPARRRALMNRRKKRVSELQAAYWRITLESALHKDDGYIGIEAALACCFEETWILKTLATAVRDKPPLLHRPGDTCAEKNCIDASGPWRDGYEYRICAFLKRNPSKAEQERRKAQKDDSRDPRLRDFVYERDGGCCRYCRSGPLNRVGMGRAKDTRRAPEFDHADPDRNAGPNAVNLYLACKRCNRDKSDDGSIRRTVREFGWQLLPVPSEQLKAYWQDRGEQLFDRPEPGQPSPADAIPDTYRDTPADTAVDTNPTPLPTGVETPLPTAVPHTSAAAVQLAEPAGERQEHLSSLSSPMSGSGRVGQQYLGVGGQPVRDASAPDIYHRRSRAPDPNPTVEPRAGPP